MKGGLGFLLIFFVDMILTFTFMVGQWATDIGASSLISSRDGVTFLVIGLFGERTGNEQYHYGLLISQLSMLILVFSNMAYIVHLKTGILGGNRP